MAQYPVLESPAPFLKGMQVACAVVKPFLLVALSVLPVAADWQRHVLTPKGERSDTPEPHPLSYFTRYPWLRDASGDFCYLCPPEKRLALAKQQKARAEVRLVGSIRGLAIFDVLYFFGENQSLDWKAILVRTQPGLYREIWHYQRNEGGIWPSYLVKIGKETLLGLEDDCYRREVIQEYYWFGENGPVRLDFSPIWEAADVAAPKDTRVWHEYDGRTDLPAGRIRVGLTRERDDWRCCSEDIVEVKFKLNGGRVVVAGTRFDPKAEVKSGHGRCR